MLVGLQDLQYLLRLVLTTGRIPGVRPVSVLVLSYLGAGKSDMTVQFAQTPGVLYATNVTPYALYRYYGRAILEGRFHHIIIPDLSLPMSKGKEEREPFVAFFNALVEEGVVRVLSSFVKWDISSVGKNAPVRCGLITCLSFPDWERRSRLWETAGFLRRLLPISYIYSQQTLETIAQALFAGKHRMNSSTPAPAITLPDPSPVYLDPELAKHIWPWAVEFEEPVKETYPIGRYKQFEALVMANALLHKRKAVTVEDIKTINAFRPFFSYKAQRAV